MSRKVNGEEEDIDAIMKDMEEKTPKLSDKKQAFDVFDAHSSHTVFTHSVVDEVTKPEADNVDARSLWSSIFTKDLPKPGKVHPSKPTNERYYDFTHSSIGYAVIFNQMRVKGEADRKGSKKDAKDLSGELTKLGFEVRVYDDLTVKQIQQELFASEYTQTFIIQ